MASSKGFKDFVLDQLRHIENIECKPMMGEFLLYADGVLFGGIYDDRLLVKIRSENKQYGMAEAIPYDGAKPMFLVEDIDDKDKLAEIVNNTVKSLTSTQRH